VATCGDDGLMAQGGAVVRRTWVRRVAPARAHERHARELGLNAQISGRRPASACTYGGGADMARRNVARAARARGPVPKLVQRSSVEHPFSQDF
jgi:hypothetical protein